MALVEKQHSLGIPWEKSAYQFEAVQRRRSGTDPLKPTSTTPDDWAFEAKRYLRRKYLESSLNSSASLSQLKADTRQHEASFNLDSSLADIFNLEPQTTPRLDAVAKEVARAVLPKFGTIKAIIVQGSAQHIKSIFGQVTGEKEPSDFDWGVITQTNRFTKPLIRFTIHLANYMVKRIIPKISQKHGLPKSFHSCESYNAVNDNTSILKSPKQAYDLIQLVKDDPVNFQILILYLLPSYPASINRQNRLILKQALDRLREENEDMWVDLVEKILFKWRSVRALSDKHLPSSSNPTTERLRHRTLNSSSRILSQSMENYLTQNPHPQSKRRKTALLSIFGQSSRH